MRTDLLRVRSMTVEDLDAVLAMEPVLFADQAWSRAAYVDELADRRTRFYVVAEDPDDDSPVVGWAGLAAYDHEAHVLTVGTRPDRQRQGIGQRLLDALLARASERRVERVVLEVRADNAAAQAMYERNGFVTVGRRPRYYGVVDGLTMVKECCP